MNSNSHRTDELVANLCDEAADGDWAECFKQMHMLARKLESELRERSGPDGRDAVLEEAAVVVESQRPTEAAQAGGNKWGAVCLAQTVCAAAIRALKKQRSGPAEADAKDAGRYRWLRVERDEQQPVVTIATFSTWGALWRDVPLWGDELDAKVDHAMAGESSATDGTGK